jgi:LacI family transcriptional regulator/LacI family repressor for deo operon, udp, cdd, tsx, nupC, and nupG
VAIEHLIAISHREIALLGVRLSTIRRRARARYQALRQADLPLRAERLLRRFSRTGGYQGIKTLLGIRQPPTAVFVANNLMTLGALRALHEMGRRIPNDVALVGFDDMPWATSLNPPLTAVAQPAQEIGESAAELLMDRIARPDRPVRHVILETRLIVRASCGAARRRQPTSDK